MGLRRRALESAHQAATCAGGNVQQEYLRRGKGVSRGWSGYRYAIASPRPHSTGGVVSTALQRLIDLLDLEELEVNIFRGVSPKEDRQRVFGGQVAGQALVAAGRTVAEGRVHSLHCYFLRPGDPKIPILYEVDRIRCGRTFTTHRVVDTQP